MVDHRRRGEIIFFSLFLMALVLGWLAHNHTRFPGDLSVTMLLQSFQSPMLRRVMEGISYVIDNWKGIILVIIAAVVFWRMSGVREGLLILLSGLFTGANELFKIIVDRPRPAANLVQVFVSQNETSFPSGHAFFAVAVLGLVAFLIAGKQSKPCRKAMVVLICTIVILLVGISRIYLGVHWASDVIGGYIAGALFLMLEVWLYQRFSLGSRETGR